MQVLGARGAELEREFAFGDRAPVARADPGAVQRRGADRAAAGSGRAGRLALALPGHDGSGRASDRGTRASVRGAPRSLLAVRQPRRGAADLPHRRRRPLGRRLLAALPGVPAAAARRSWRGDRRGGAGRASPAPMPGSWPRWPPIRARSSSGSRRSPGPRWVSSWPTGSAPFQIRRSSRPACAPPAGRRFSCVSWSRAARGGGRATAAAAEHVEQIGARTVGRSILLRLDRLPESAARLARAVAILERGRAVAGGRLAELAVDEAPTPPTGSPPPTSSRPAVRWPSLTRSCGPASTRRSPPSRRARGHRAAARMLAEDHGANERVAEHLLASDPGDDAVGGGAARGGGARRGAQRRARVGGRVPASRPGGAAAAGDRPGLVLELGMAEASAGLPTWPSRLQAALEAPRRRRTRGRGDGAGPRPGSRLSAPPRRSTCSTAPRRCLIRRRTGWPRASRPPPSASA